ncbi:MAG: glycosyltransferase [Burkholderiales bacterium]|nr:glycosyltransferase [Burkholderiales bacterium]
MTRGRADDVAFAAGYAQIAVLLAGSAPSMQFAWLGDADEAVQAVLKAAQVQVLPCRDAHERADQLARAWLYVAPEGDSLDARGVIEAMATGLPCVARPGTVCGELVIDQLSGVVCPRNEDLRQGIARLVDAPQRRRSMGRAARERALQRYSRHRFQASMLLAHGLSPAQAPRPAAPPLRSAFA